MHYAFPIRATSKDEAKAAIAEQFDEITAASAPADWSGPQAAVDALIDNLEDNASLDLVVTVAGEVVFIGDKVHHLTFSFSAILTDR